MKFKGIIPALVTPFTADDNVNPDAIRRVIDRLIDEKVGGLFVCGSTGEWWSMSIEERMLVAETAVDAVKGRAPVMVHVAHASTRYAVQLAQHAEKAGAQAISALPPVGGPTTAETVWDHFKAVGDNCRLPLYLYHLPQVYGDLITIEKFVEALDCMPTLAGVKFSSYRIDDLLDLRNKVGDRLNIISGCAEQLLSAIVCGAEGSICIWYNIIPRLACKIIECVEKNDIAAARGHEETLVAFGKICIGKAIGNLKMLMARRGFDCGVPRKPTPSPTPEEKEKTLVALEKTGIFEWMI